MLTQERVFESHSNLAASITHASSKQTYYTIFLLVDPGLTQDAYRAYAYFRWLDDQLDMGGLNKAECLAFIKRETALVDQCYGIERSDSPRLLCEEEYMLVDLIRSNPHPNIGLELYIRNMMEVMAFDAERRGRLITQQELADYSYWLAKAVTEALHYFIGQRCGSPQIESRYLAVTGAHIVHMLRDTLEDIQAGYFNIPSEYLTEHGIDPQDVTSDAYRAYVKSRVELARSCFDAGKEYLAQVENLRCRLTGYSYMARFTPILNMIEHDDYLLRAHYR
jgi:phytoene/squalene synthetase